MFEFLFRKRGAKKALGGIKRESKKLTTQESGYQAVRIHSRLDSCEAARALAGQAFLCAQAPMIPLPDCQQGARCRCIYEHIPDRRLDARRDSDIGLMGQRVDVDRRTRQDRRKEESFSF